MYRNNYIIPETGNYMYRNSTNPTGIQRQDDRFLFPFLVGGVAGTALGYGLANNNPVYYPYPPYYPPYYGPQPYPIYYPGRR